MLPEEPHFPGKVKRVIYLFHAGAPSQLELYDPKPGLTERSANCLRPSCWKAIEPRSSIRIRAARAEVQVSAGGRVRMELSEILPHTANIADEMCLIRSLHTDAVNHAPGQIMMNTGSQQFGRPSFGGLDAVWAW
ncbi:MAG: DUF1501 domain-containing protein [Pirellulaceae bacterium]